VSGAGSPPAPTTADIDHFARVAAERLALAHLLDGLGETGWETPSLCRGWRVREVVAHLLMPFSLSTAELSSRLAANGFDFDAVADDWARAEPRTNGELVAALRANADHPFTPPGAGPEAPLTELVVHGQDIRRPLGLPTDVDPVTANVVLDQLVTAGARQAFGPGLLEGVSLVSTTTGWSHGQGPAASGPPEALIPTMAGRRGAVEELSGPGVDLLARRLAN